MDGFKNTTKMKYMCGGPVRKATGGAIKSVAPKGVMKSAASAKQLPTPEVASKRQVQPTPPKDVGRELPRPTMEPKRLIAQTPTEDKGRELPRPTMEPKRSVNRPAPEDVRTIGGAPKASKGAGRELPRPEMAPKDVRTIGGEPKAPKDVAGPAWMGTFAKAAQTTGGAPKGAKTMGSVSPAAKTMGGAPKGVKTMGGAAQTMGGASRDAKTMGSVSPAAKTMGSVGMAKKGVPVASNKPMIGQYKTGGYVSKSSFKW
jgi:hypothetical protein